MIKSPLIFRYETNQFATWLAGNDCNLTVIRDAATDSSFVHITRKDFPFLEQFNSIISTMNDKTVSEIMNNMYEHRKMPVCEALSPDTSLNLVQLFGIFQLLAAGLIAGLVAFAAETLARFFCKFGTHCR